MSVQVSALMSDEFVAFSTKVAELHNHKKALVVEFKKIYETHKAELKSIDEQVIALQQEFDKWAATQGK